MNLIIKKSIISIDLQCSSDDDNEDGFQDTLSEEDLPGGSSTLMQENTTNPSQIQEEPSSIGMESGQRETVYMNPAFIKTEMKQEPTHEMGVNNSRGNNKTESQGNVSSENLHL